MASITSSARPIERVAFNRLLWVGPLTILAAIVANVIIQQIAVTVLQPDPLFIPLTLIAPIVFTFVGVLGAVIVYALIGRFSRRPIRLFTIVAAVALVLSFASPLSIPGAGAGYIAVLELLHITTAAIAVGLLTRLARKA